MGNLVFGTCVQIIAGSTMQFLDSGATYSTSLLGKRTFFFALKTQESSSFRNVICDSVVYVLKTVEKVFLPISDVP